ncbi:MAG: lipopolysaccharide transport periplasmic protein LptA [Xanthomonadales bacterium]|nr:lipopolysaccharide transport periplasmic protein LptA [Xanthomonadales bacterium]
MQLINRHSANWKGLWLSLSLIFFSPALMALESDRQQPLELNADSTDGTLGDGITTLRGNVEIHQGSLHITADEAEVAKVDGRVSSVTFRGKPAFLEQEIEEQGLVQATANVINYQVASGLVTLTGSADVKHPQYQISGEILTYDLNVQHFQGSGDENGNGRIHIRLDPEVINKKEKEDKDGDSGKPSTPVESSDKDDSQDAQS